MVEKVDKLADVTERLRKEEEKLAYARTEEGKQVAELEKRITSTKEKIAKEEGSGKLERNYSKELKQSLMAPFEAIRSAIPKPVEILASWGLSKLGAGIKSAWQKRKEHRGPSQGEQRKHGDALYEYGADDTGWNWKKVTESGKRGQIAKKEVAEELNKGQGELIKEGEGHTELLKKINFRLATLPLMLKIFKFAFRRKATSKMTEAELEKGEDGGGALEKGLFAGGAGSGNNITKILKKGGFLRGLLGGLLIGTGGRAGLGIMAAIITAMVTAGNTLLAGIGVTISGLAKFGAIAFPVAIIFWGLYSAMKVVEDFIKGFDEDGLSGAIGQALGGSGSGPLNVAGQGLKGAGIGALVGLAAFGPIGAIIGGLLGLSLGAIFGWLGSEKIQKWIDRIFGLPEGELLSEAQLKQIEEEKKKIAATIKTTTAELTSIQTEMQSIQDAVSARGYMYESERLRLEELVKIENEAIAKIEAAQAAEAKLDVAKKKHQLAKTQAEQKKVDNELKIVGQKWTDIELEIIKMKDDLIALDKVGQLTDESRQVRLDQIASLEAQAETQKAIKRQLRDEEFRLEAEAQKQQLELAKGEGFWTGKWVETKQNLKNLWDGKYLPKWLREPASEWLPLWMRQPIAITLQHDLPEGIGSLWQDISNFWEGKDSEGNPLFDLPEWMFTPISDLSLPDFNAILENIKSKFTGGVADMLSNIPKWALPEAAEEWIEQNRTTESKAQEKKQKVAEEIAVIDKEIQDINAMKGQIKDWDAHIEQYPAAQKTLDGYNQRLKELEVKKSQLKKGHNVYTSPAGSDRHPTSSLSLYPNQIGISKVLGNSEGHPVSGLKKPASASITPHGEIKPGPPEDALTTAALTAYASTAGSATSTSIIDASNSNNDNSQTIVNNNPTQRGMQGRYAEMMLQMMSSDPAVDSGTWSRGRRRFSK